MKTASCKAKGRKACQEVKELLHLYAPDLQPDDIRVTPSGCTGPDLWLSPAAMLKYGYAIESKNQEKISIWEALKQAESHAENTSLTPLLVFRRNRGKLYVALELEAFLRATT